MVMLISLFWGIYYNSKTIFEWQQSCGENKKLFIRNGIGNRIPMSRVFKHLVSLEIPNGKMIKFEIYIEGPITFIYYEIANIHWGMWDSYEEVG